MSIFNIRHAWKIAGAARRLLADNDPFRMAGATAFFTTFALPPILIIVVRTLGLFAGRRLIGRQLEQQLDKIFGPDSVAGFQQAIRGFRSLQYNYLVGAGVFIFLLFVATTLFRVIKNSINQIWSIRLKPHTGLLAVLKARAIAVAVILLGGLLFLAVQLADAGWHLLARYLMDGYPAATFFLSKLLNQVVVIAVTTLWFYVLFLFLPDGRPVRKVALGGAFVTALLFSAGKAVIRILLEPARVNSFYGASGAIVLVLLFMFYASAIFYFGAALIQVWSDAAGKPIALRTQAFRYRLEEAPLKG